MSDLRQVVRRELDLIRRDARRPWRRWPRRTSGAVVVAVRAVGEFLKDLVLEIAGELLLVGISVGLLAVLAALVSWGWARSPAATVVLLVGTAGFVAYGGYELFGRTETRRGRLAATAAGTAVFAGLWALGLITYYVG